MDLQSTVMALFQELVPSISTERLKMDRIHRTLTPCPEEGPPCDIVVKLHFFRMKEQLITASRQKESLVFQGHGYQIFHDISQVTLAKWKAMKPNLHILQHCITYRWGFPFSVRFSFKGTSYLCKLVENLQITLQELL